MKNDTLYAKAIAKNLRRIMYDCDRTQAQISKDLGIPKTTISGWINGNRVPRMKYVDLLCHYFNCSRADIIDAENGYYSKTKTVGPGNEIMRLFEMLNEAGQKQAIDYLRYLAQSDQFKKESVRIS